MGRFAKISPLFSSVELAQDLLLGSFAPLCVGGMQSVGGCLACFGVNPFCSELFAPLGMCVVVCVFACLVSVRE